VFVSIIVLVIGGSKGTSNRRAK